MRRTFEQVMWGHQGIFRSSLGRLAHGTLSQAGIQVAAEALLVGLSEEADARGPICLEPGNGPHTQEDLKDILEKADRLYEAHPQRRDIISDPGSYARFQRGLLESYRRDAISEALGNSGPGADRLFFVGYPGNVAGYRVYPVISVLKDRWLSYAQLKKQQSFSGITTRPSLQEAVVVEALDAATAALGRRVAPGALGSGDGRAPDLIRHAALDFVNRLVAVHGDWNGLGFLEAMDAVAAQPYEGRTGIGTIVLAKENHPRVAPLVRFSDPIVLSETRSFRKALEMTGLNLHLLSDGVHAYGLGNVSEEYDSEAETVYSVKVVGRGSWELAHHNLRLLRVDNGVARLPQERISEDKFVDTVGRIYGEAGDAQALWDLTQAAAKQQHGTMLVVHRNAGDEAKRLAPQALSIEPRRLEAEALSSLTAIDGAILVAPDGNCHAVGVILDGVAVTGTGDAARGARYNSAVRYHSMQENSCIIVIVSEDGMINLLPDLARRVTRSSVERAVAALEQASHGEVDFEAVSRCDRLVSSLSFYLSAQQCDRTNEARERVELAREQSGSGITWVGYDKIQPKSEMDASYFFPEPELADPSPEAS